MYLFFIIAFVATTIGSLAGLGGGIIIKPFLLSLTSLSLVNINILSSVTVFIMATISIFKRRNSKPTTIKSFKPIIIGSIFGGIIGNQIFNFLIQNINNHVLIEDFQSIMLSLLLFVALFSNKLSEFFHIDSNKKNLFATGFFLAIISSFLSIGGGPINVAIFIILFSLDIKSASFISLIIIFFSQGTSLITFSITSSFKGLFLKPLIFMIPASIIGANLGSYLTIHLSAKKVLLIFNTTLIFLIFLNIFNVLT